MFAPSHLIVAFALVVSALFQQVEAAPITFNFSGEITHVDDIDNVLGGGVAVGGAFSGSFTFESTQPNGSPIPSFGRYFYDNVPGAFSMTANVGPFTFQTAELDPFNFSSEIGVRNNDVMLLPRDAYHVFSREVVEAGGAFDVVDGMQIELITFANLGAFTNVQLPLTPPPLGLFESTNWYTVSGMRNDLGRFFIRGTLTSLELQRAEVPEPGALGMWAAMICIGGVMAWRRRRKEHRKADMAALAS